MTLSAEPSTQQLTITVVTSNQDKKDYIDLPFRLYRDVASWVPPFRSDIRSALKNTKSIVSGPAVARHWVCRRGDRTVGRISAVIDHDFIAQHRKEMHFGAFDCEDDADAARALLGAVETWAAAEGFANVTGPYTYSASGESGVLIGQTDTRPVSFEAYTPPYFPALLEASGYSPLFHMSAYTWDVDRHHDSKDRILQRGDDIVAKHGLTVRHANMRNFKEDCRIMVDINNRAFHQHPEITPISWDFFWHQAKGMKTILDPDLITFIERDGEPLAFSLLLPNLGEFLGRYNGKILPKFVLQLRGNIKRTRSAVVVMLGALPEYHGLGLGRVLVAEMARVMTTGRYDALHTTWIHEHNRQSRALVALLGAPASREYAVFSKAI